MSDILERQTDTGADEKLIWHEQGRKELLKTPVFTVTERHSTGPDGQEGDYIVNEARDWVIVIADDGEDFLMVHQWRHGEQALSWEFPGGVIDDGEDPETAAKRELMEETGACAKELIHLGTMNPNPALFSNHVHVYHAKELEFTGVQHLDHDEFVSYKKIPKKEVFKGMGKKEYPHALMTSAAGLYLIKNSF